MNGNFLGIDDVYRVGGPMRNAYMKDARGVGALKTAGCRAWLERAA